MRRNGSNGQGDQQLIAKMEVITPALAGDLLAKNTYNRKMSNYMAQRLAETMVAGDWHGDNGETIKIAADGTVLDGQHRLAAVVMADRAVPMLIARNVPKETFETIDIGRSRRMADMLHIRGVSEGERSLARALYVLHGYLAVANFSSLPLARRATPTELFELLKQHDGLHTSIAVGDRTHRKLPNVSSGIATVLHYLFQQRDPTAAQRFFDDLCDGAGLTDEAFLRLRDRLMNRRFGRIGSNEVAALLIKAWNARRTGARVTSISFRSGGPKPEQFPKPV